jgi:hypothetical protein
MPGNAAGPEAVREGHGALRHDLRPAARRVLREQPTARAAIHAMLRPTADQVTRPDSPHYCMLILTAPTGTVENHAVREFLADLRHDMLTTTKVRLSRGITDGDLTARPPASTPSPGTTPRWCKPYPCKPAAAPTAPSWKRSSPAQ